MGQAVPLVRLSIDAIHSCPLSQIHHTFLSEPTVTSNGVRVPFFIGCHSLARFGLRVAKSLKPLNTTRFEQYGQPVPLTR